MHFQFQANPRIALQTFIFAWSYLQLTTFEFSIMTDWWLKSYQILDEIEGPSGKKGHVPFGILNFKKKKNLILDM